MSNELGDAANHSGIGGGEDGGDDGAAAATNLNGREM